jgi:hypothetical protein
MWTQGLNLTRRRPEPYGLSESLGLWLNRFQPNPPSTQTLRFKRRFVFGVTQVEGYVLGLGFRVYPRFGEPITLGVG